MCDLHIISTTISLACPERVLFACPCAQLLPLEVLPMLLEIAPTAEERELLTQFNGDASTLARPEQMLRTLAFIPHLEGRLQSMMFKSQLEVDMDSYLMPRVRDLRAACESVRDSRELHALMQIVLDVGNALNAGTSKGNAVGFKLSTLLKLAELKAVDKKFAPARQHNHFSSIA